MDIKDVFEYRTTYRQTSVAEHEALLSFHSDDDCVRFFDWMNKEGERLFLTYLANVHGDE